MQRDRCGGWVRRSELIERARKRKRAGENKLHLGSVDGAGNGPLRPLEAEAAPQGRPAVRLRSMPRFGRIVVIVSIAIRLSSSDARRAACLMSLTTGVGSAFATRRRAHSPGDLRQNLDRDGRDLATSTGTDVTSRTRATVPWPCQATETLRGTGEDELAAFADLRIQLDERRHPERLEAIERRGRATFREGAAAQSRAAEGGG